MWPRCLEEKKETREADRRTKSYCCVDFCQDFLCFFLFNILRSCIQLVEGTKTGKPEKKSREDQKNKTVIAILD